MLKGGREIIDEKTSDEEIQYYSLVRSVFNTLSPFYDILTFPFSGVRHKTVNFINAAAGSKILDVATGTGKQAFAFAKKGYEVIGIDLTEAMLKVACKKNKYNTVKFKVADAANLPFESNCFDVSCVSFALHDMPLTIIEKVLKEMLRVLKPKGLIVIVDYSLPKNKIGRFLIYNFVKLYEKEYYITFIKSDFEALLKKTGVEIKGELPVLFGAGKILKGINMKEDVR